MPKQPNSLQKNPYPFNSPLLNQLQQRLSAYPIISPIQESAVLVILTDEPQPKMLYTLRASTLNHHAGEVSFAGGRHENTDESNLATALREAWEEIGVVPEMVKILGELPIQQTKSGTQCQPIVGVIPADTALVAQPSEIERIFWADLAMLINQPTFIYEKTYPNMIIRSPAFLIDNETVWGLTGRITASLLEIGFDRKIDWRFVVKGLV